MLTISTALSAISCLLTSIVFFQRDGDLLEKAFAKTVEAVENNEGSNLRGSCICKCPSLEVAPFVLGGICLCGFLFFIGLCFGRRCAAQAVAQSSLLAGEPVSATAPAPTSAIGGVAGAAPVARKRRFATPASLASSSTE